MNQNTDDIISFLAINPIFIVFCSLIGLFSFVLSIIFYFKSKRVKKLSYIVRNFNVIDDSVSKIEDLGVTYKGMEVKSLSVSKFGIWNEGNETINGTDLVKNDRLRIAVTKGVEILDWKVISHTKLANDIIIEGIPDSENIAIEFEYLDPNDGILLQVYHTGINKTDIYLDGSIKGITKFVNHIDYNWNDRNGLIFAPKPLTLTEFIKNFLPFSYLIFTIYTYSLIVDKINTTINIVLIPALIIATLGSGFFILHSLFIKKPKGFRLRVQEE